MIYNHPENELLWVTGILYLFLTFFQDYVKLFMDLAEDSLGYVDWQPHIPKV